MNTKIIVTIILLYLIIGCITEQIIYNKFMQEVNDPDSPLDKYDIKKFNFFISGLIWPRWVILFIVTFIEEMIKELKKGR